MGAPFNQYIRYLAQTRLAEQEAQRQQALLDRTREYVGGLLGQEQQMAPAGSQAEFQAFNQIPFEAAGQMTPEQQVMTQQGKGLIGGEMSQPEFFAGLLSAPTQQAQELGAQGLLSMMAPSSSQGLPSDVREYQWFMQNVVPNGKEAIQRYMSLKRAGFTLGGQRFGPATDAGLNDVTVPASVTAQGENTVGLAQQAAKEGRTIGPQGMTTVPGSSTAKEEQVKGRTAAKIAGFVSRDIRMANDLLSKSSDNPYFRIAQSKLPGTDEYEYQQQIKSLQATIGIDSLLDIKREGAGLGQVPQTQLDLLSRLLGQLDIARDKEIQKRLLSDIQTTYAEVLKRMSPEEREQYAIPNRELQNIESQDNKNRRLKYNPETGRLE